MEITNLKFGYPKRVFGPFTCTFPLNKLTYVIGVSGSGKSTLFNILGNRGDCRVWDGKISYTHNARSALIPQYYQPVGNISLKSALKYRYLLLSKEEQWILPKDFIEIIVELNSSFPLDAPYSKLSSGEQKLYALFLQLLASKSIVLIDEPTTGLDGHTAEKVMHHILNLSNLKGYTFICNIHQPSPLTMSYAHHLIVVDKHFRCIYEGPTGQPLWSALIEYSTPLYSEMNVNDYDLCMQAITTESKPQNTFDNSCYTFTNSKKGGAEAFASGVRDIFYFRNFGSVFIRELHSIIHDKIFWLSNAISIASWLILLSILAFQKYTLRNDDEHKSQYFTFDTLLLLLFTVRFSFVNAITLPMLTSFEGWYHEISLGYSSMLIFLSTFFLTRIVLGRIVEIVLLSFVVAFITTTNIVYMLRIITVQLIILGLGCSNMLAAWSILGFKHPFEAHIINTILTFIYVGSSGILLSNNIQSVVGAKISPVGSLALWLKNEVYTYIWIPFIYISIALFIVCLCFGYKRYKSSTLLFSI